MQVIFIRPLKGQAHIGEIKTVADGFGRFLLAKGIAKRADKGAQKEAVDLQKKREAEIENRMKWAKELTDKVSDLVLTIEADANEEGHLYGSVDAKAIATAAGEQGLKLSVDDVILPHGLKEVGEHVVQLDLTPDHKPKLKVTITKK